MNPQRRVFRSDAPLLGRALKCVVSFLAFFTALEARAGSGASRKTPRPKLIQCAQILKRYSDEELNKTGPGLLGLLLFSRNENRASTVLVSVPGTMASHNA